MEREGVDVGASQPVVQVLGPLLGRVNGSQLIAAGWDVAAVAARLGDSNARTFRIPVGPSTGPAGRIP